jgi:hypothetical protein
MSTAFVIVGNGVFLDRDTKRGDQPMAPGYLVLLPAYTSQPVTSSVSFGAGQTRGNTAIVRLSEEPRWP